MSIDHHNVLSVVSSRCATWHWRYTVHTLSPLFSPYRASGDAH